MSDNQGSFVSGLTIGFLAGAAGYFLFGTDKGKKMRAELEREWRAAQASGHLKVTKDENQIAGLGDIVSSLVRYVREQQVVTGKGKELVAKAKGRPRKANSKFKGV